MLKKALIFIMSAFCLLSCANTTKKHNTEYGRTKFDYSTSYDKTRKPLHNQKYIDKAQNNIATNNLDEDDIHNENIIMYQTLMETGSVCGHHRRSLYDVNRKYYESIIQNKKKTDSEITKLQKTIDQIKLELENTKKDLSNRRAAQTKNETKKIQEKNKPAAKAKNISTKKKLESKISNKSNNIKNKKLTDKKEPNKNKCDIKVKNSNKSKKIKAKQAESKQVKSKQLQNVKKQQDNVCKGKFEHKKSDKKQDKNIDKLNQNESTIIEPAKSISI